MPKHTRKGQGYNHKYKTRLKKSAQAQTIEALKCQNEHIFERGKSKVHSHWQHDNAKMHTASIVVVLALTP